MQKRNSNKIDEENLPINMTSDVKASDPSQIPIIERGFSDSTTALCKSLSQ